MLTDVVGNSPPLLEMHAISKTFPGVKALDGVSLTIRPGEILALMGENGAGKSTLMKVLSGAYQADPGGRILMHGQPVAIASPADAKRLGIAIIYQELSLSPNLTVAENIHIGDEPRRGPFVNRRAMRKAAQDLLSRLGVTFGPDTLVGSLSIAEQQMVEIARALRVRSKVLVMDEPTTALSSRETERLFALMRRLRQDGLGIVYISHRMAEIYELADRVSVLRDGSYVGTLERAALNPDTLVRMMVGRKLESFYAHKHADADTNRPPVSAVVDRVNGCKAVLAKAPGIKLLSDNQNGKGSREGGPGVMIGLPIGFDKADAVFTINDPQAIGADLAAKQLGRKNLFITSVDGAPDIEVALKSDTLIEASSAQDPFTMAKKAVELGHQVMQGKKPDKDTFLIPAELIARANAGQYSGWASK